PLGEFPFGQFGSVTRRQRVEEFLGACIPAQIERFELRIGYRVPDLGRYRCAQHNRQRKNEHAAQYTLEHGSLPPYRGFYSYLHCQSRSARRKLKGHTPTTAWVHAQAMIRATRPMPSFISDSSSAA